MLQLRMVERRFLNPYEKVRFTRNRLPHRQQEGITYFVTFRLADSLPRPLLDQWRSERDTWLRLHPEPRNEQESTEYHQRFTASIERWLDDGHGSCLLRYPEYRHCLERALRRFDQNYYLHHAWVIMPNHVHVLFSLRAGQTIEASLRRWKGSSSRGINQHRGSSGTLWMKDYFDRMIRDAAHFWRCARYIRFNPKETRLRKQDYTHFESSQVQEVLDGRACG